MTRVIIYKNGENIRRWQQSLADGYGRLAAACAGPEPIALRPQRLPFTPDPEMLEAFAIGTVDDTT